MHREETAMGEWEKEWLSDPPELCADGCVVFNVITAGLPAVVTMWADTSASLRAIHDTRSPIDIMDPASPWIVFEVEGQLCLGQIPEVHPPFRAITPFGKSTDLAAPIEFYIGWETAHIYRKNNWVTHLVTW